MITSESKIHTAQLGDRTICTDGRFNKVVDPDGTARRCGIMAPPSAPSVDFSVGSGGMVPGVSYSYLYTFFNSKSNVESPAGPESDYSTLGSSGVGTTVRVGCDGMDGPDDPESTEVWVGGNISEETGEYNNQTIAIKIVNNEYGAIYSEWQFRKIVSYEWDETRGIGKITVNRKFFNVDPDAGEQKYSFKIATIESETGLVGGKCESNTIVLDVISTGQPADAKYYMLKMIVITNGQGKGQRKIIIGAKKPLKVYDIETGESTERVVLIVDSPWKKKPFYYQKTAAASAYDDNGKKIKDNSMKNRLMEVGDLDVNREKKEKKGYLRDQKFYDMMYSSEYAICDPFGNDGLVIRGKVGTGKPVGDIPCLDKNTIRINEEHPSAIAQGGPSKAFWTNPPTTDTGEIKSYTDSTGTKDDIVTIDKAISTDDVGLLEGKIFRIVKGPAEGFYATIKAADCPPNSKVTKLTLSTSGLLTKRFKGKPNSKSFWCIYGEEEITPPNGMKLPTGTGVAGQWGTATTLLVAIANTNYDEIKARLPEIGEPLCQGPLTTACANSASIALIFTDALHPASSENDAYNGMYLYFDYCNESVLIKDYDGASKVATLEKVINTAAADWIAVADKAKQLPVSVSYVATGTVTGANGGKTQEKSWITRNVLFALDDGSKIWLKLDFRHTVTVNMDDPESDSENLNYPGDFFVPTANELFVIRRNVLRDGYYTGWKVIFYDDDQPEKTIKNGSCTVVGYLDAFGAIIVDNPPKKLVGGSVNPTDFLMYCEYTSSIGSRLIPYYESTTQDQSTWNSRFFRLDWWANNYDDAYKAWRVSIPYGWAKKKATGKGLSLTGMNKNYDFTAYEYDGDMHKVDVGFDTRIFPVPNGDEYVFLFDPTTSIFGLFDSTLDSANTANTNKTVGQDFMLATVSGFVLPTDHSIDKIKLYRAAETAQIYQLVAEIPVTKLHTDGKYVDQQSVEMLGMAIDLGRANVAVARYCTSHKERMIYAGGFSETIGLTLINGTPIGKSAATGTHVCARMHHEGVGVSLVESSGGTPVVERYALKKIFPTCCMNLGNDVTYLKFRHNSVFDAEGDMFIKLYYKRAATSNIYWPTYADPVVYGKVATASGVTITLTNAQSPSTSDDAYNNYYMRIGTEERRITNYEYDAAGPTYTFTLATGFTTDPSAGANVQIIKPLEVQRETTKFHSTLVRPMTGVPLFADAVVGNGTTSNAITATTSDAAARSCAKLSPIDDYYIGQYFKYVNPADENDFTFIRITDYTVTLTGTRVTSATFVTASALANGTTYHMARVAPWPGGGISQVASGATLRGKRLDLNAAYDDAFIGLYLSDGTNHRPITDYAGATKVVTFTGGDLSKTTDIIMEMLTKFVFLDETASTQDDYYNEMELTINGQSEKIKDYHGNERMCELYTEKYIPVSVSNYPVRIKQVKWRQQIPYSTDWASLELECTQADISSYDRLYVGVGSGTALLEYMGIWVGDDTGPAPLEYHASTLSKTGLAESTSPKAVMPCLRAGGCNCDVYSSAYSAILTWDSYAAQVSIILDRPFEKTSGAYYAHDHDGLNALQIASVTEPEIIQLEGVLSIPDADGDSIQGVIDTGDYILIFQQHSVWRYDPIKLTLKLIGEKVGCVAPHTLKKGKMGVYWLSDGGTICRMNSQGSVSVINGQILPWMSGYGKDVEPYAVGDHPVDYDHIDQACAAYDMPGDSYIIALPRKDTGSTDYAAGYNTLVFRFDESSNFWSRKCYAKTAGAVTTNYMRIYTMFNGADGIGFCGYHGLYRFDGTDAEIFTGDSKIPWGIASAWMSEANPEKQKLIKRIALSNTPSPSTLDAAVATTATMRFQKDRLATYIPSFQSVSGAEARTLSTTTTTVLLHAGVRALVWRFVLEGYGYLCISDINTEMRPKETPAESWGTV